MKKLIDSLKNFAELSLNLMQLLFRSLVQSSAIINISLLFALSELEFFATDFLIGEF